MAARVLAFLAALGVAVPAAAEELKPEQAKRLLAGKLFSYSCFDGTSGVGRIFADGSVAGIIRIPGMKQPRYMSLPAGTLQVKPHAVCANMKGLVFQPCFKVVQTGAHTFRGSIAGFGFAYCDFNGGRGARLELARAAPPRTGASTRD